MLSRVVKDYASDYRSDIVVRAESRPTDALSCGLVEWRVANLFSPI